MASDPGFVEFVLEQFEPDLGVTAKKMFGEYGLFSGGKMFALICDDRLFIKPTDAGMAFMGEMPRAAPYPGAKEIPVVEDRLEDGAWLSEVARLTVPELPAPKRRKKKGS